MRTSYPLFIGVLTTFNIFSECTAALLSNTAVRKTTCSDTPTPVLTLTALPSIPLHATDRLTGTLSASIGAGMGPGTGIPTVRWPPHGTGRGTGIPTLTWPPHGTGDGTGSPTVIWPPHGTGNGTGIPIVTWPPHGTGGGTGSPTMIWPPHGTGDGTGMVAWPPHGTGHGTGTPTLIWPPHGTGRGAGIPTVTLPPHEIATILSTHTQWVPCTVESTEAPLPPTRNGRTIVEVRSEEFEAKTHVIRMTKTMSSCPNIEPSATSDAGQIQPLPTTGQPGNPSSAVSGGRDSLHIVVGLACILSGAQLLL